MCPAYIITVKVGRIKEQKLNTCIWISAFPYGYTPDKLLGRCFHHPPDLMPAVTEELQYSYYNFVLQI